MFDGMNINICLPKWTNLTTISKLKWKRPRSAACCIDQLLKKTVDVLQPVSKQVLLQINLMNNEHAWYCMVEMYLVQQYDFQMQIGII